MAKRFSIEEKERIAQELEQMEDMEAQYTSVSDAVRVGFLNRAMEILRRWQDIGYEYTEVGPLASNARSKTNIPHPTRAGGKGVAAGHSENTPASGNFSQETGSSRGAAKSAPSKGEGTEE